MKAEEKTVRAGERNVSTIAKKADLSADHTATDEAVLEDESSHCEKEACEGFAKAVTATTGRK